MESMDEEHDHRFHMQQFSAGSLSRGETQKLWHAPIAGFTVTEASSKIRSSRCRICNYIRVKNPFDWNNRSISHIIVVRALIYSTSLVLWSYLVPIDPSSALQLILILTALSIECRCRFIVCMQYSFCSGRTNSDCWPMITNLEFSEPQQLLF
jgi:hypothetical protein